MRLRGLCGHCLAYRRRMMLIVGVGMRMWRAIWMTAKPTPLLAAF